MTCQVNNANNVMLKNRIWCIFMICIVSDKTWNFKGGIVGLGCELWGGRNVNIFSKISIDRAKQHA